MADQPVTGTPVLDTSTRLAFVRTRASYERTMMSWIRTATSLITFGFSVYKFFQFEKPVSGSEDRFIGPRGFALTLVSVGLIALVLATLEFRHNIRTLGKESGGRIRSLSVLMASFVCLLGIAALVLMLLRQ